MNVIIPPQLLDNIITNKIIDNWISKSPLMSLAISRQGLFLIISIFPQISAELCFSFLPHLPFVCDQLLLSLWPSYLLLGYFQIVWKNDKVFEAKKNNPKVIF